MGGAKPMMMGGASLSVGGMKFDQPGSLQDSLVSEHTATLQNQLNLTSYMCNQLLYGQNNLIRAVCSHLDRAQAYPAVPTPSQLAEHMAVLQQYEMELEAYYHQLCESYARVGNGEDIN